MGRAVPTHSGQGLPIFAYTMYCVGPSVVLLLIAQAATAARAWDAFREQHACTPVVSVAVPGSWARPATARDRAGDALWTVTVVPRKTGYRCDDGLMHWH